MPEKHRGFKTIRIKYNFFAIVFCRGCDRDIVDEQTNFCVYLRVIVNKLYICRNVNILSSHVGCGWPPYDAQSVAEHDSLRP